MLFGGYFLGMQGPGQRWRQYGGISSSRRQHMTAGAQQQHSSMHLGIRHLGDLLAAFLREAGVRQNGQ